MDVLADFAGVYQHYPIRPRDFRARGPSQCRYPKSSSKQRIHGRARENIAPASAISRAGIRASFGPGRNGGWLAPRQPTGDTLQAHERRIPIPAAGFGGRVSRCMAQVSLARNFPFEKKLFLRTTNHSNFSGLRLKSNRILLVFGAAGLCFAQVPKPVDLDSEPKPSDEKSNALSFRAKRGISLRFRDKKYQEREIPRFARNDRIRTC